MVGLHNMLWAVETLTNEAEYSLDQPRSRRSFLKSSAAWIATLFWFSSFGRAAPLQSRVSHPDFSTSQYDVVTDTEPPTADTSEIDPLSDIETKLCTWWEQSSDFTQLTLTQRALESVPGPLQFGISSLHPQQRKKVQSDIFQEHIYALYMTNKTTFSDIFEILGVPQHRHFATYCILQVLFTRHMNEATANTEGTSGATNSDENDRIYALTPSAFSRLLDPTHPSFLSWPELGSYLQELHVKKNPKLSGSESVFYNAVPEVGPEQLPPPQQYIIRTDAWSLRTSPRLHRNKAIPALQEAWYLFSSTRTANTDHLANIYARDTTCAHGCTEDVITYMQYLRTVINKLCWPDMVVPMVVSGITEPGHGLTSKFSQQPKTAWYLTDHLSEATATLTVAERDKIAKTHGSGNKIDISSRWLVWYLLSTYFWLWKENSVVTKKETISWKAYIVEARYHLGHFDICILPEHLYELTK